MLSAVYGKSTRVAPVPDECWKQRCLKAEKEAEEARAENKRLLAEMKKMHALMQERTTRVVYAADNEKTQKLKQELTSKVSKLETAQRKIDQLNMQLNECKQKVFSFDRIMKATKQKHENEIDRLKGAMLFHHNLHEREVDRYKQEVSKMDARIMELKDSRPVGGDDKRRTVKEIKRMVLCEVLTKNSLFDSITADVMRDPMLLRCGHAFSKEPLETWWAKNKGEHDNECPMCRKRTGVYAKLF